MFAQSGITPASRLPLPAQRPLQLPLPAQRPLQLHLHLHLQLQLLLLLKLLLTWVPVDGATSPAPKSDKKRLLFERSELQTLPDFGAGGVGSLRAARTAI